MSRLHRGARGPRRPATQLRVHERLGAADVAIVARIVVSIGGDRCGSFMIDNDKRELRKRMKALLASLPRDVRAKAGRAVVDPILEHVGDGPVSLFASLPDEIDTHFLDDALRARGIPRASPRIEEHELQLHVIPPDVALKDMDRATLNIPTPDIAWPRVRFDECSLVLVPALALDRKGGRLGRGKGYYDRALTNVDINKAIGLVLDEQLIDKVPVTSHDVRLSRLCIPALGVVSASA
jgi:5-formyltetrahydrofolate cyclo-ligase